MAGRKKGDGQKFLFKGELLTIPEIAEKYHIATSTVRTRFKQGYSEDDIIKKKELKKYTINGETLTIKEFARKYNISEQALRYRLTHNVPEDQLFVPSGELIPTKREAANTKELQYKQSLSWTDSAIECYYSVNCDTCTIPDDLKPKCKMRKTVLKIIDMYGEPYGNDNFINGKDKTMSELREQEIAKYRERLQPYIDEVMAKYERKERRQAIYDRYIKKLKSSY